MFVSMFSWRFRRWSMPTRSCGGTWHRFMRMFVFGRSRGVWRVSICPRRGSRWRIIFPVRAGPTRSRRHRTLVTILCGGGGWGNGYRNGKGWMTFYPRRAGRAESPAFLTWRRSAFRPVFGRRTTWRTSNMLFKFSSTTTSVISMSPYQHKTHFFY